ncbi:hypothetical protein BACCOPRO_02330 [Phocaeicola coprophilus DSM 18228 = JCM 13818]|uniref:Uncharacterized protein n=1 Tax=Phocaeicola coprophilus DSM 18228 = JCM 13818 TaxID=547042 RepID=S0F8X5_9BACT|nr:hypothetical protein BACCOPRO_02330 [Phocaeicola coprophilus DSM 18228 = JCM 13818]
MMKRLRRFPDVLPISFFIFTLPPFREKTFKSLFSFFRNVSKNLFHFCQINAKLL